MHFLPCDANLNAQTGRSLWVFEVLLNQFKSNSRGSLIQHKHGYMVRLLATDAYLARRLQLHIRMSRTEHNAVLC